MSAAASSNGCSLADVSARYGDVTALHGVSLAIEPGQAVAIVGPSGAGKTTLLQLFNGAVVPQQGQVVVQGTPLTGLASPELRRLRSRIGFIHQDLRLVPNLRVSRNVLSGGFGRLSFWQSLRLFLRPPASEMAAVHRLLEQVGIGDLLYQRVDRLSGGQKQRVAIARALYQRPQMMLADEPVASVDPVRGAELLSLLTGICAEQDLTLVVSLHNPELARRFFHRLIGLRAGRIVFDASTTTVTDKQFTELYAIGEDREF